MARPLTLEILFGLKQPVKVKYRPMFGNQVVTLSLEHPACGCIDAVLTPQNGRAEIIAWDDTSCKNKLLATEAGALERGRFVHAGVNLDMVFKAEK